MVERFRADGWRDSDLHTWSYDYWQSNARTAEEIRERVDRILSETGATKVDIVTHSMGGLSSRYYAKHLGGQEKIDAFVSIGGPNHGTYWSYACYSESCFEMRPGSTFLAELNSGDETPGSPRYATWWSPCDEIINPDESVMLSGARNVKTWCIGHVSLLYSRSVYTQVRDWVSR